MGIKIQEAIIFTILLNIFWKIDATSTTVNTATYFPLNVDIGNKNVQFVNIIKEDLRYNNDDYAEKGLYNISNPYLNTRWSTTATYTVPNRKIYTKAGKNCDKLYAKKAQAMNNNSLKDIKRRAYSLDSEDPRERGSFYPQNAGKRGQLLDSQETEKRGNLQVSQDAGKRGKKTYPLDKGKRGQLLESGEAGNIGTLLYSQDTGKQGKVLYPRVPEKREQVFNQTVKYNKIEPIERHFGSTARNSKRFLKVTTGPQIATNQPGYHRFTNQYTEYVKQNKAEKLLQLIDQKNSLLDKFISRNKIESHTVAMTPSDTRVAVNNAIAYPVLRAMHRDVIPKLPDPDQLDMAHAKGPRVLSMRIKGRLCHRSILHPEGPKYDSKGKVYQSGFVPRGIGNRRRDFENTRPPTLLLPRCCNCCKKSVLGCE